VGLDPEQAAYVMFGISNKANNIIIPISPPQGFPYL